MSERPPVLAPALVERLRAELGGGARHPARLVKRAGQVALRRVVGPIVRRALEQGPAPAGDAPAPAAQAEAELQLLRAELRSVRQALTELNARVDTVSRPETPSRGPVE